MKKTFTIFIFLLVLQVSVFSQTIFDEYRNISIDDERYRVINLVEYLLKNPETKALFLVHAKENETRFGNVVGYLQGVKKYISDRNFDLNRIDFEIVKGKERFTKEIWILEKGEKFPPFERLNYNFDNLTVNYLYASACLICEPPYEEFSPSQINFNHLSQIIKRNCNYKILLELGEKSAYSDFHEKNMFNPKEYANKIRNLLLKKYKIDKKNFAYEIVKNSEEVNFYIIPKKK